MAAARPAISQNPDIRYLGRLLGDVIRIYGGERIFKQTEYIRSTSVDRARGVAPVDGVENGLSVLTLDDTLAFVRGFMLFSMLANLAEDRQGIATEPGADMASAVERLKAHGVSQDDIIKLLEGALVAPVLTAHPTEVRRKSMIDHRNVIADLMTLRDTGASETDEREPIDDAIVRQIAPLWQTRPIRRKRRFGRVGTGYWASACRAFCGWARGLAAIAMAIPSCKPISCALHCAGRADRRCASI